MDVFKSLFQPLVAGGQNSGLVDGVKLVVLGGTVETARRISSSAWSHFVNSFFLTAHFSEDDYPYEWLILWLNRRPEWQRAREFETTTLVNTPGLSRTADNSFGDDEDDGDDESAPGRPKTRVIFQPTFDTTHTIYYRGHWLRVKRGRKSDGSGCEVLSISVVARNNSILKQLVLQAKREYEAEAIHRIQIYFADSHGSWRWTDSRHKRPMNSIVLNPGVKEMLLNDTRDFLKSEKWYADRGIPFRRGYLLHGVPGSGKSSLIHAIAGELMLDIYVVSLSSSWISDSTLTTLMGRVPSRCILLLEDLDAAFTRSVSRDKNSTGSPDGSTNGEESDANVPTVPSSSTSKSRRNKDQISDINTLSLSGLLNALDGVAAAEGRILFATTNHLERLDPALSRPGRMDVWIEFKNASKWQAEALFRNFFPCSEELAKDEEIEFDESELDGIDLPSPPANTTPSSPPQSPVSSVSSALWSLSPSFASSTSSLPASSKGKGKVRSALPEFGASNQAYPPPLVEEHIANGQHSAKPLDSATLGALAKKFADSIPEEEFSVAALQGYLLKNKSQPDAAANDAAKWVISEREMKERLKREKEAKEQKDKEEKAKKKRESTAKEKEKSELEKKELEIERLKQQLKEKDTSAVKDKSSDELVISTESVVAVPDNASSDSDEENVPPASIPDSDSWATQPVVQANEPIGWD